MIKMSDNEVRLRQQENREKRKAKKLRKWEEKYVKLGKKLDSTFKSRMEEAMYGKGINISVNPMLYRPTALLRYVVKRGLESDIKHNIDSPFLDAIRMGIIRCISRKYMYCEPELYREIGLKVILRHLTYGPSELDEIYHLDSWAIYLKREYPRMKEEGMVPENTKLDEFFDSVVTNPRNYLIDVDTLFNSVLEDLAEYTFNLIKSGKAPAPRKGEDDLETMLNYSLKSSCDFIEVTNSVYGELYSFILENNFDSFDEFEEKGILEFFNEYMKKYEDSSEEVIKEVIKRRQIRKERQLFKRAKLEVAVNLQTTSMFGDVLKTLEEYDDVFVSAEEEAEYENSQLNSKEAVNEGVSRRPVRKYPADTESVQRRLEEKREKATQIGKAIDDLEDDIKKLNALIYSKQDELKNKNTSRELLVAQEKDLWDEIEEMERNLK